MGEPVAATLQALRAQQRPSQPRTVEMASTKPQRGTKLRGPVGAGPSCLRNLALDQPPSELPTRSWIPLDTPSSPVTPRHRRQPAREAQAEHLR